MKIPWMPLRPLQSRSEKILRNTVIVFLVVFFVTFFFAPILIALVGSFHLWNPLKGLFVFNGLSNWVTAFQSTLFWRSMINTAYYCVVAVAARVVIGMALASALFSGLTAGKSVFRTLYYLPTITPMIAVAFVWKFMFQPRFGLLNQVLGTQINWLFDSHYAMPAILLLTVWKDFGFAVVILLGGMYALPSDCFEAAKIDGASGWQRFAYITLPLLKPTTFFLVITSLIAYFQNYIPVMVLTEGGPGTITYVASYIIYDQAFVKYNFGYSSAISFILFVIIAALTLVSFRANGMLEGRAHA